MTSPTAEAIAEAERILRSWSNLFPEVMAAVASALQAKMDEVERLRAALERSKDVSDALQESQYRAGMSAGWNFCAMDDDKGFQKAMEYQGHLAVLAEQKETGA